MAKLKIEWEERTINEAIQLIYKRWSQEYDLLKKVKDERPDGSKDWAAFHAARLKNHTDAEARWNSIFNEVKPYSTIGK